MYVCMYLCMYVYMYGCLCAGKNANLNLVGLPLPAQQPFCNQPILSHLTPPHPIRQQHQIWLCSVTPTFLTYPSPLHPTMTSNLCVQRNMMKKCDQWRAKRPHQKRDSLLFGTGSYGRKFIVHKILDLHVKGVMTCCSVDCKRYLHLRPSMLEFNFENLQRFVNQFLALCVRAHMHIDRGL